MSDLLSAKKLFEKGIKEFNNNNYINSAIEIANLKKIF